MVPKEKSEDHPNYYKGDNEWLTQDFIAIHTSTQDVSEESQQPSCWDP